MKSLSVRLGIVFIGLIILGCVHERRAIEPHGFMGMKWGESIKQCKERGLCLKVVPWEDNVTRATGVESSIGYIVVKVEYFFGQNKLGAVTAQFNGEKEFDYLLLALKGEYGEPKSEEPLNNIYGARIGTQTNWEISNVAINLRYSLVSGDGRLTYSYKPILRER